MAAVGRTEKLEYWELLSPGEARGNALKKLAKLRRHAIWVHFAKIHFG